MVDSLVAVSAALIAATGCLAFVTASALFGARIFRWLHPAGPEHPVHSLVAIAIGLGALAHTTLALGLAGLLNRWALLALLAGFALAGRREFGPLYRSLREVCLSAVRTDLVTKVIAAILLIHVLAYIVVGLVPITGADAVKFYVTFPKRYVEDGSIHHIGPHTHSGTPQSGSMFYAVAMAAVNREAAALVPPFFLAATILLIVAMGARLDRPRAGWAAAALFACCPGVSTQIGMNHNVESMLVFFAAGAFASFYEYMRSRSRSWLACSAILGGFAASTKLNGLFLAAATGICLLALHLLPSPRVWSRTLGHALLYGLLFLAVATPWYALNYKWHANPVFPLYSHDETARVAYGEEHNRPNTVAGYTLSFWNIFNDPGALRFSRRFYLASSPNPALLVFVPLLLLFRVLPPWVRYSLLAILVFHFLWFIGPNQHTRYLMPVLPLAALLAAHAWSRFEKTGRGLGLLARAAVGVTLLWSLGITSLYAVQFTPILIGRQSKSAFIRERVRFYGAVSWANTHLDPRADRLLVLTHMTYYLDVPYTYWPGEFGKRDLANCADHHELYRRLKEMGVTHVLLVHSELLAGHRSQARIETLLAALSGAYGREVYRNDSEMMGTRNPLDQRSVASSRIVALR